MHHTMIVAEVMAQGGGITAQSGEGLKNVVLGIIGSLLLIVMAGRMLASYTEERYGKMISLVAGGAAVAGVVYFPDTAISIVKGLFSQFTGAA